MCTAITYKQNYYGRNLDLEYDLKFSKVVITPQKYHLQFRVSNLDLGIKYSLIGIAMVVDNYPLYYDAMNEHGLFMAGLNFDGYAKFFDISKEKNNVAPFELIPYILGNCKNLIEVKEKLKDINIVNVNFNSNLSLSPLHWIVSDNTTSLVIESVADGLKIYDNPIGVLTNNPDFPFHLTNLNNFLNLNPKNPLNCFSSAPYLKNISNGSGTIGLPGGLSSIDRFIRASYTKLTSISENNEISDITQFFHILGSVSQTRGTVMAHENRYELTLYSNCYSSKTLTLYYKTYNNSQINALNLKNENISNSTVLKTFDLFKPQNINSLN
ncbi:choloylglycine hydrolase [Mycoplasmoides alvi]|uniref:choloylglycine hydrolase n=1 Tax=Mycoplasmoides alvi TaxID=78580 RepID=UPI00051AC266|nr:choloylglycine hydrolase [Mycoplasmoides alvi]